MIHRLSLRFLPLLTLAALFASCSSDSTTTTAPITGKGSILGTISDSTNGVGIPHAMLTIVPALRTVSTDTNGLFEVDSLSAGTYYITVTKSPYRTLVDSVVVVANQLTKFNRMLGKPTVPGSDTLGTIVKWKLVPSGTIQDLTGVCYADAQTVFVTGKAGTLLRSSDGGNNWMSVGPSVHYNLNAIHFTSATTGVAVGDSGHILRTTDGGSNWTDFFYSPYATFHAISFYSNYEAVAVGADQGLGVAMVTTDGGQNWLAHGGIGTHIPWGVQWNAKDTILAAGEQGRYYRTFTRGQVWEENQFGAPDFYNLTFGSSSFGSSNKGLMIGSGGKIYYTLNGGQLWNNTLGGTSMKLYGAATSDPGHWWIVGESGTILQSPDAISWTATPTSASPNLHGIAMQNKTHGVIVGDGGAILVPVVQ